jgi:CDP-diacylglycerol--glycerol-3-phosphate 3-phosphatidyltransferase
MNGLYALKPWYADQLAGPRQSLIKHNVTPTAVSWTGVVMAAGAGACLAFGRPGPLIALAVAGLLALRLACANLDGGIARLTGRTQPWGSVTNELTDRLADLCALAGLSAHVPLALLAVAALCATLPSWCSLAGSATGASRMQGAGLGKTERCALLVVAALIGHDPLIVAVIAIGSLLTAVARLFVIHRQLADPR